MEMPFAVCERGEASRVGDKIPVPAAQLSHALVEDYHRLAGSEVLVLRLLSTLALLRVVVYHWWQIEMNDYRRINAGKWESRTRTGSVFKNRFTYHLNTPFCNSVWSIDKTIWTFAISRTRNPGARDISGVQTVLLIDQTLLQKRLLD